MNKILITIFLAALVLGCSKNPTDSSDKMTNNEISEGSISINLQSTISTDPLAPSFVSEVDNLFLTITEISVMNVDDEQWVVLFDQEITVDILELIGGVTVDLADLNIETGNYTQVRLVVADINEIVIDGESFPLVVPSGVQTGVKLNLLFAVVEDQVIELAVNFDIDRSVIDTEQSYLLRPAFSVTEVE